MGSLHRICGEATLQGQRKHCTCFPLSQVGLTIPLVHPWMLGRQQFWKDLNFGKPFAKSHHYTRLTCAARHYSCQNMRGTCKRAAHCAMHARERFADGLGCEPRSYCCWALSYALWRSDTTPDIPCKHIPVHMHSIPDQSLLVTFHRFSQLRLRRRGGFLPASQRTLPIALKRTALPT